MHILYSFPDGHQQTDASDGSLDLLLLEQGNAFQKRVRLIVPLPIKCPVLSCPVILVILVSLKTVSRRIFFHFIFLQS